MSLPGMSGSGAGSASSSTPAINNSLRFRASASAYLSRTFGSPSNAYICTLSLWMKRGAFSSTNAFYGCEAGGTDATNLGIRFSSDFFSMVGGVTNYRQTNRLFRDPAAFMHFMIAVDTTQATAANRIKIYVDNVQQTSFSTENAPTQNTSIAINSANAQAIGKYGASYFDGVLAQVCLVDGQALTPSAFGATDSTSGEWKPKTNAQIRTAVGTGGTRNQWGTNGFLLDFTNTASTTTLGYDHSQSDSDTGGNNWTCNNISLTSGVTYDAFIDSPNNGATATQPVGNYATLNPLDKSASFSPTRANLQWTVTASHAAVRGTLVIPDSSFIYYEATIGTLTAGSNQCTLGVCTSSLSMTASPETAGAYCVRAAGSISVIDNGSATAGPAGGSTAGQVLQVAIDRASNKMWVGRDNTWYNSSGGTTGNPSAGTNATFSSVPANVFPYIHCYDDTLDVNFGQRPFAYTPPTGFKALCTANLGTPAIDKPSAHFFAKTRTGTGSSYSVTGIEFSPDLVVSKSRSAATDWAVYDTVRGVQKDIGFNLATDQTTQAQGVTAFNSDGYMGGTLAKINTNAATYIDYFFNESATAGLDIVQYTGTGSATTIAHNLGVVPKMIIVHAITTAGADQDWPIYHANLTSASYWCPLNTTTVEASDSTVWNGTAPTSSVFSVGTSTKTNTSGDTYIAYVFADVAGYCKAGGFIGSAAADGIFIYTGFRPRFVLIRGINLAFNTRVYDSARNTYNVVDKEIYPSLTDVEGTATSFDLVSNGIKMRSSGVPNSAHNYIYLAIAESPIQYANAR